MPSPALVVPAVILVAAAIVDLRSREISNAFPLLLLAWAVASRYLGFQDPRPWPLVWGLLVGMALGLLPFALGVLGGGDAKLLAALGAVVGPLALLVIASWIACLGGVFALVARARHVKELAYAPAIALGYVGAVFLA